MTDNQIEAAARELCRLRGIDPDKLEFHSAEANSNGYVPDIALCSPSWMLRVKDIEKFLHLEQSVAFGRNAK